MTHRTTNRGAAPTMGAAFARALVLIALVVTAGCAEPTPATVQAQEAAAIAQAQAETAAVAEHTATQIAQARRDARIAELQAEAAEADKLQADRWRAVRVGALNAALVALFLVPVLALAAAVAYGLKRRAVWMPRRGDGALPFDRRTMTADDSREALRGRQAADLALASVQPVPQTLTYSPRSDYRNDVDVDVAGADSAAIPAPTAFPVPRFAELLASGVIGPGQPLYLGLGPEGPLTGSWKSIYSAGVGGLQGSGKTWSVVMLILQALVHDARVMVIDPHADGGEDGLGTRLAPVAGYLARPVAADEHDMLAVLKQVTAELDRRRHDGGKDRQPWLLAIDEWTAIQRGEAAELVAGVLEAVTQEGRKLGINALLLGQRWSATRGGGNDLRNTLTSAFVHRMRPEDARMLTGLRAESLPKDMLQLAPGECYVQTTAGDFTRVRMPLMEEADVVQVAAYLAASRAASGAASEGLPGGGYRLPAAIAEDGGKALDGAASGAASGANDPLYDEVRAMLVQGAGMAEIRDQLAGEPVKGGGRAFQAANTRLTAILQSLALESMVQTPAEEEP